MKTSTQNHTKHNTNFVDNLLEVKNKYLTNFRFIASCVTLLMILAITSGCQTYEKIEKEMDDRDATKTAILWTQTTTPSATPIPTAASTPTATSTPTPTLTPTPVLLAYEVISPNNIDRLQVLQIEGLGDTGHMSENLDMYNSPENNTLVVVTNHKISFLDEDTLEEKNRIELPSLYQQIHPDMPLAGFPVDAVAISEDLHRLATLYDGSISIWDIQTDDLLIEFIFSYEYDSVKLRFSENCEKLAVQTRIYNDDKRNVYIVDLTNGDMIRGFEGYHFTSWMDYVFSSTPQTPFLSEGSQILLTKGSKNELFDISKDAPILSFEPQPGWINNSAIYSPNHEYVAMISGNKGTSKENKRNKIHVYRVSDGEHVFVDTISEIASYMVFSDDSTLFAYPTQSSIRVWKVEDWSLVQTLYAPARNGFKTVAFSEGGTKIAAITDYDHYNIGYEPAKLFIWDIDSGSILLSDYTIWTHAKLIFSSDEENLFVFERNEISQFQLQDKKRTIHPLGGRRFSFFSSGNLLASGSTGETVSIWNLSDGSLVSQLGSVSNKKDIKFSAPDSVAKTIFSPDGQLIAAQTYLGAVLLYDLEREELVSRLLNGYDTYVRNHWMGFSQDGTMFAAFDGKYNVYLWDVASGQVIVKMPMPKLNIGSIYDNLFFESSDNTLYTKFVTWDISNCELENDNTEPREHCGTMTLNKRGYLPSNPFGLINPWRLPDINDRDIATLAVSPDENIAVVGYFRSYTQVFDLVRRKCVMEIPLVMEGRGILYNFSPDGKYLIMDDFVILGIK